MRRALLLATATLSFVLLFVAVAHADAAPVITPRAAAHAAHVAGSEVTWRSTYAFDDVDPSSDVARIELARPITATLDTSRSPGVTAVHDAAGALVGFVIAIDRSSHRRALVVVLHASIDHDGADILVAAPLARGEAVQRIDVVGDDDCRFEPSPSLGLVHDVGFWAAPGVSNAARRDCDESLGIREVPIDDAPVYVQSTSTAIERGLRGRVLTGAERARPGMIFVLMAFLVLATGIVAIYPWLSRRARIEQAEAALREEYEEIARHSGRS